MSPDDHMRTTGPRFCKIREQYLFERNAEPPQLGLDPFDPLVNLGLGQCPRLIRKRLILSISFGSLAEPEVPGSFGITIWNLLPSRTSRK